MGYFVKIQKPQQLKTLLLESARDVIILLRKTDEIEQLKIEKEKLIEDIQNDLDYLKQKSDYLHSILTNDKLRQEIEKTATVMPNLQNKNVVPSPQKTKPQINKPQKELSYNKQSTSELDKLEQTLNKIEQKLKDLSD